MPEDGASPVIKVLTKTVQALEALAASQGRELTLVELARATELPVSTTSRILASLERCEWVRRDPGTRRYRIGSRLRVLGSAPDDPDLRRLARPHLEALVAATGESGLLTVRDGDEGVYLDRVDSPHGIRLHAAIGARAPLHCGATRLVLLAGLPETDREAFLARPLVRKTRRTVTSAGVLRARLREIRARGYAVSLGENTEGAAAVAAPVRDAAGVVVASLSAAGPVTRFTRARIARIARAVVRAADGSSASLGYPGVPGRRGAPSSGGPPPPPRARRAGTVATA